MEKWFREFGQSGKCNLGPEGGGITREDRDDDGKKTKNELRGGVQGVGGTDGDSRRQDARRDCRAVRVAPASGVEIGKEQQLERVSKV